MSIINLCKQRQCLLEHLLLLTRISLSKENLGQWNVIDPIWYQKSKNFIRLLVVKVRTMPPERWVFKFFGCMALDV